MAKITLRTPETDLPADDPLAATVHAGGNGEALEQRQQRHNALVVSVKASIREAPIFVGGGYSTTNRSVAQSSQWVEFLELVKLVPINPLGREDLIR